MTRIKIFISAMLIMYSISMYSAKFEGWFLLMEFEPVYDSPHGKSKSSRTRLYFIKDIGFYLNDSIDFNCFLPRNIIRLMNLNNEGSRKDWLESYNKKSDIVKKRFGVDETDSLFILHFKSTVFFNDNLRNNCCEGLKKDESRKLHFFYGKMEGEYYDEYRELFCDDYLRYIPRYVYFPLEDCNKLEYRFSIVLPPPSRILRFYEDFKFRE